MEEACVYMTAAVVAGVLHRAGVFETAAVRAHNTPAQSRFRTLTGSEGGALIPWQRVRERYTRACVRKAASMRHADKALVGGWRRAEAG